MKLRSRRQLNVERLETRTLLAADVGTSLDSDVAVVEESHNQNESQGSEIRTTPVDVNVIAAKQNATKAIRLTPTSSFGLAEAIATVGPHGTVVVEAGVYSESSVMITNPVTIVGEAGAVIEFDSNVSATHDIDPGFHIKDTRNVRIQGLEIRDNDTGSSAVLIEGSEHVTIQDNRISGFQYGVLVESADHSTVRDNVIDVPSVPAATFGVTIANGFGNQVQGNTVSGFVFGIFASGENGKVLRNTTTSNVVGVILCYIPQILHLPDGRVSGSEVPATDWLIQGNTSSDNLTVGYLVIDGANGNTLTNNEAGNNGTYDIELTDLTDRFGRTDLPASYDNIVNVGSHQGLSILDKGIDNKVHTNG